jgi:hypothetical protein
MLLVLLLPWDLFVVGPTKISHEEDTFFNQFLNPFLDKSASRYVLTLRQKSYPPQVADYLSITIPRLPE